MVEIVGGSSQSARGRMPTGLRAIRAQGNKVLLEGGRWYTDWVMGNHGAIYGYAPDWWVKALRDAAGFGQVTSVGCRNERIVAEMLGAFYPDVEAVRFMCTGSDPNAAAVKLARAVTGRGKILVYGYHGTNQAFCTPPEVSGTKIDMRRGVLAEDTSSFVPLQWDPCFFQEEIHWPQSGLDERIAAVVIECPSWDGGQNNASMWAKRLAEGAHRHGALFVLDEVKTAFRYGRGGAAEYLGLQGQVDLYCFGKTLGNGYPVSCLAGKASIVRELTNGVHFSGTFFGEPLGMAVAKATLHQLSLEEPWAHLHYIGKTLKKFWNDHHESEMVGHPTRPEVAPDAFEDFARHQRDLFLHGHIVTQSPWYVTTCTTRDDIEGLVW